MKTVNQVTKLTGITARTLQYYDEIGLLKPSEPTICSLQHHYHLYHHPATEFTGFSR